MTEPAFITFSEAAEMIGVSTDTLRRNLGSYQAEGFPGRDPLVNKYPRAKVQAFIDARTGEGATVNLSDSQGVNTDAFS